VTLGSTSGQVVVRVSIANATPAEFTLTTNLVINSVTLISGGGQSANPSSAFANPVVFEVRDNNGAAVGAGVTLNFSANNGASLGSSSATTNAQGRAQTTVTAGTQIGTITVTAGVSGKTATAELQVRPPTLPLDANSFTNAASRDAGLVPCGLGTLTGAGLAPTPGTFASGVSAFGPWQTTVAGVSIRVNGVLSPIQVVANQNGVQSVNFQTPCQTQPGVATVVVTVNGTDTTISNVPVYVAQPGIFTYSQDGKSYGAVIRIKDGSYITPDNPAPTGEDYYLILTGLGQGTPALTTNSAGLDQTVNTTMVVGVNNGGVPSQVARYLTGNTGIYYIRFTIPRQAGAATGTILRDVPLATFAVVNGQIVFGNPTLLPAILQQ
jgi:adhesin/invasin